MNDLILKAICKIIGWSAIATITLWIAGVITLDFAAFVLIILIIISFG